MVRGWRRQHRGVSDDGGVANGLTIGVIAVVAAVLIGACSTRVDNPAEEMDGIHLDLIELPRGFEIELVTDQVPGARSLELSPNGILYVGTRGAGNVYAVTGVLDQAEQVSVATIATGLEVPNGVAWREGSLYVAERTRILRFEDIDSRLLDPGTPALVRDGYPDDRLHGWRFIRFGPDDMLYVPVGAPCNACESEDPIYGSITRIDPATGEREIVAHGIRNSVGFDWNPETGELWFTDNGADLMGDDLPPDELNRVTGSGLHFGFPYCHGGDFPDPDLGDERPCDQTVRPAIKLGPHVAALGMRFYTEEQFPSEYRGQIFIAEHGSWNRTDPTGYRVSVVRLEEGRAVEYTGFAEGWLQGEEAWGRPVDVEVAPDGALLVSDDMSGAIYRITYSETS